VHAGWGSQIQSSMRSLLRVVTHVDTEHPIEMPTPADEDVVQAFRADGPHEPLREGIGLRRPDRGADDPDFFRPEYLVERCRELRVPVTDEEPQVPEPSVDREVPRLLRDPRRVGMRGRAHHVDSPGLKLDEEQDVDRLQPDRLDGEEVGREDPRRL
jgi:hypothetical protein